MTDGHTYSIKKREEDDFATLIEKGNITAEFTARDLFNERERAKKLVTELQGKLDLAKAKCENIEHHHPFVKDMSLQDLFTCHMYYEQKVLIDEEKGLGSKIQELKDEIDYVDKEFVIIAERTGLDILPKTNEEIVDSAVAKITEGEV